MGELRDWSCVFAFTGDGDGSARPIFFVVFGKPVHLGPSFFAGTPAFCFFLAGLESIIGDRGADLFFGENSDDLAADGTPALATASPAVKQRLVVVDDLLLAPCGGRVPRLAWLPPFSKR